MQRKHLYNFSLSVIRVVCIILYMLKDSNPIYAEFSQLVAAVTHERTGANSYRLSNML